MPLGRWEVPAMAGEDIGRVAAEVFSAPGNFSSQTLFPAGERQKIDDYIGKLAKVCHQHSQFHLILCTQARTLAQNLDEGAACWFTNAQSRATPPNCDVKSLQSLPAQPQCLSACLVCRIQTALPAAIPAAALDVCAGSCSQFRPATFAA